MPHHPRDRSRNIKELVGGKGEAFTPFQLRELEAQLGCSPLFDIEDGWIYHGLTGHRINTLPLRYPLW